MNKLALHCGLLPVFLITGTLTSGWISLSLFGLGLNSLLVLVDMLMRRPQVQPEPVITKTPKQKKTVDPPAFKPPTQSPMKTPLKTPTKTPIKRQQTPPSLISTIPFSVSPYKQSAKPLVQTVVQRQDKLKIVSQEQTRDKWNIGPYQLSWIQNTKSWMIYKLLKPTIEKLDVLESRLKAFNRDLYTRDPFPWQLTQDPTIKECLFVEKLLNQFQNRHYVVDRIKTLYSSLLAQYQYNSGGSFNQKQWTSDLPTDSNLLIALVTAYLDSLSLGVDSGSFSHYIVKNQDKLDVYPGIRILHSENQNHFQIIVGESIYDIESGRDNLFLCLALFVHYIKTNNSGYLGALSLGISSIDLLQIVQDGPMIHYFSPKKPMR